MVQVSCVISSVAIGDLLLDASDEFVYISGSGQDGASSFHGTRPLWAAAARLHGERVGSHFLASVHAATSPEESMRLQSLSAVFSSSSVHCVLISFTSPEVTSA